MFRIILLLVLLSEISAENQGYAPEITKVRDRLQYKPCDRNRDNLVAPAVPSLPNPILIQSSNTDAPKEVFKSASLKNYNNEKIISEPGEKYPEHRHDDLFEQHFILPPANMNKKDDENPGIFNGNTLVSNKKLNNDENGDDALNVTPESTTTNKVKIYFEKLLNDVLHPKQSEKIVIDPKKSVQDETKPISSLQVSSDKESEECINKNQNTDYVRDALDTRRFFSDSSSLKNDIPRSRIPESDEDEEEPEEVNRRAFQSIDVALLDPAKGAGITDMSSSPVNLLTHTRVCYACSTMSNPTCWQPDRRTTVKYCQQGHEACVTKTFQTNSEWVLTRDCGKSCEDTDILGTKYKSCSVCHTDMCNDAPNGSPPINANKIAISMIILLVGKYAM